MYDIGDVCVVFDFIYVKYFFSLSIPISPQGTNQLQLEENLQANSRSACGRGTWA